jgi:transcriptional regulator with XRE-family HTH domain
MKNEAQKQFIEALNFLLKKEGHGSQAKLARTLKIDPGFLNNMLKGRTPGPQAKKERIASYFNLRYESMLSLGRWILSGHSGESWQSAQNDQGANFKSEFDNFVLCGKTVRYEYSARDRQDKNMLLIAEWIDQQNDPDEYWIFLKMAMARDIPEFKEWLKKRSSGGDQGRLSENKSVVGE